MNRNAFTLIEPFGISCSGLNKVKRGFTLIELLVVVTIIVVLLSLLAPAMDKAIYEAGLAVCSAQLHGHVAGVQQYAFDNRRYFPQRGALNFWGFWPTYLKSKNNDNQTWYDDRPKIKPYVTMKMHLDPLASDKVNVYEDDDEFSMVLSTYALWYGWTFTNPDAGGAGATRVGQKLTWLDDRLDILVSDQDWREGVQLIGSHQDDDGVMSLLEMINDDNYVAQPGVTQASGYVTTGVRWYLRQAGGTERGLLDTNHGMQDGSVVRLSNVPDGRYHDAADYSGGRLAKICSDYRGNETAATQRFVQVPR